MQQDSFFSLMIRTIILLSYKKIAILEHHYEIAIGVDNSNLFYKKETSIFNFLKVWLTL